ncbi:hypothetical protein CU254_02535 [Amycolatopsis sp. AA4]|uniref:hypothetical protein n=1 Tax=Actinomycetes TaxID=1760 RepID=UPI0001DEE06E|nr:MULTISPECIES: hypothetical protein [Actinomycetes]ATY09478.1 hypothetical protein CU254_02535 [Amycolatopsis sp. AA4]EFL04821.1 predicted protein [Streptomyces sp. AA4]
MLERQRTRREPDAVRVEDVIPPELLENVAEADREYLEQVVREPQKYLPPRARRPIVRDETPVEEPESKLARRAKLAGLVGAGALVAGAVVTASLLTGGPRPTVPVAGGAALPAGFSGAAALGGQAVPQQRKVHSSGGTTSGQSESTTQSKHTDSATTTPLNSGTTTPETTSGTSASSPSAPSLAESHKKSATSSAAAPNPVKLEAVRKFYASIDHQPENALSLLTPNVARGEMGDLVRAWSGADSIDVQELHVQDDGSVFAVALVHQADGTLVRVTQLFDVVEQDVISQARVLSAVYS